METLAGDPRRGGPTDVDLGWGPWAWRSYGYLHGDPGRGDPTDTWGPLPGTLGVGVLRYLGTLVGDPTDTWGPWLGILPIPGDPCRERWAWGS